MLGCGSGVGLNYQVLQPGESVSSDYRCFNRPLTQADKPIYVLLINWDKDIKEHNKENNRLSAYITFN